MIIKTKEYNNYLLKIKEQKEKQKCWLVSEIEEIEDIENKIKCFDCGKCNNCHACFNCGEHYVYKRKPKCPKCRSDKVKPTLLKKFEKKDGRKICPHCKSEDIQFYYFYNKENKEKEEIICENCGGKNLKFGGKILVKKMVIKRLPKFKKE